MHCNIYAAEVWVLKYSLMVFFSFYSAYHESPTHTLSSMSHGELKALMQPEQNSKPSPIGNDASYLGLYFRDGARKSRSLPIVHPPPAAVVSWRFGVCQHEQVTYWAIGVFDLPRSHLNGAFGHTWTDRHRYKPSKIRTNIKWNMRRLTHRSD